MSDEGVSRRRLLLGATAFAGASLLEVASLRGAFDHRSLPAASASERYAAALRTLDGAALAEGAIVHVGHSTHLLQVAGARFLTDPWFYDPAFGALAHSAGPAVAPEAIGTLDAVLVSHDHPDHADVRAIDRLDKRATVFVATSELRARIARLGFAAVHVLSPWESARVGAAATVHAVPAEHDVFEVGFVIVGSGQSVYFAGDTRLHAEMPAIAERFHPTTAILPVDGTRVAFGAMHVMTPDDAVRAAGILGVRSVMPSHDEAEFSDPLVGAALASTVAFAKMRFVEKLARAFPQVRAETPRPGDVTRLS